MCGLFLDYQMVLSEKRFLEQMQTLSHRGPDDHEVEKFAGARFGFHRLALRGLGPRGNQPFKHDEWMVMCNGEIYNDHALREMLQKNVPEYSFQGESDCEVLVPLLLKLSSSFLVKELVTILDGEFAFCAVDKNRRLIIARDALGIRPLFWGHSKEGALFVASEAKALIGICDHIDPFPPGHFYDSSTGECVPFFQAHDYRFKNHPQFRYQTEEEACKVIRETLYNGVVKRLNTQAPLGFLLSGGLDSSLVCALAAKALGSGKKLKTFAVGLNIDPIDLKYAKEVADFLGTEHHEIILTHDDILQQVVPLIKQLETWDVTTIRASLPMSLMCKWIRQHTPIKALLTGEVSDELFGYKYTDFAPNSEEFCNEAVKRVHEIYQYDVLRADRSLAMYSLEARVPFSDDLFVRAVLDIAPELKMNHHNKGKYLLRQSFVGMNLLPDSILWREKAAFSDAVGHSMVDQLKLYAENKYSALDLEAAQEKYRYHCPPQTKEALWYRDIFESFYPEKAKWVKSLWLPNLTWPNCQVQDPSARVLKNYGASGV
jgi:asparagine synthase (glutamine-hydrolysing)